MPDGEEATSSAIAFALAGVLFVAAISTVLVYANDRIPPPSKSQPHDELSAEARVLLRTLVLAEWDTTSTADWSDATGWTKSGSKRPSLRDCPNSSTCAGSVELDLDRVNKLAASTSTTVGTYPYEELRELLDLTERGRGFNLTITRTDNGASLLQYGEELPQVATRPAVSYLMVDDGAGGVPVRVTVHVFLLCGQGACLDT